VSSRRFPPPWSVEEQPACFVVRDGTTALPLKEAHQFDCFRKALVSKRPQKHDEPDDQADSAIGGKADIGTTLRNVRLMTQTDMPKAHLV